jgi:hypothetical protein
MSMNTEGLDGAAVEDATYILQVEKKIPLRTHLSLVRFAISYHHDFQATVRTEMRLWYESVNRGI